MPKEITLSDNPLEIRKQLAKLSRVEIFQLREQARSTLALEDFVMYGDYVH